jgi:hypothetical protein
VLHRLLMQILPQSRNATFFAAMARLSVPSHSRSRDFRDEPALLQLQPSSQSRPPIADVESYNGFAEQGGCGFAHEPPL